PPQQLDKIAATTAKAKHMTRKRILPEHHLYLRRQTVEPLAHISGASRQPYPGARRQAVHRSCLMICPQRLAVDFPAKAHTRPPPKPNSTDAPAIRPPRPPIISRDLDRHHAAAFDDRLRQQLPPPSEQLVAVHIMTPRHHRYRRPGQQRLRHHLPLQRFRI